MFLCVEGTLLEGRDSVVLRARDGGWGECLQGTDKTHFVREPVQLTHDTRALTGPETPRTRPAAPTPIQVQRLIFIRA